MSRSTNSLILNDISFKYSDALDPILYEFSIGFYDGWTGIVGPNGSGKSSLLHLINGKLQLDSGTIQKPGRVCLVAQRTDHAPPGLLQLAEGNYHESWVWRSSLGIQTEWFDRWNTLSHGERKRLQIAVALAQEPDALLLDEPDNHLDIQTRDILLNALQKFRGIGLIVSHDRHLLDTLCSHTLFLGDTNHDLRIGGYTKAKREREREQLELRRQRDSLQREENKLRQELKRRSVESSRTKGRRSRRHLARGDSDGKAKIGMAIYSGKDKKAGRLKQVMTDRVDELKEKRSTIPIQEQFSSGIKLEGIAGRNPFIINETAASFQATGSLNIDLPDLQLERGQRVGLTGPNGSGKTLLLKFFLKRTTLADSEILYLPQEITRSEGSRLVATLNRLTPEEKGSALTIVRRLGSDPEGLLYGKTISPGESRKLLLALGMSQDCSLLVLDEPTNHLDILAVSCLEEALQEWPGAILLVSHDRYFVNNVAETVWKLEMTTPNRSRVSIV
ncbi:MAG: ATP-binding cassette domain-containing protein [Candidatus Marinimicrobia bacterium]|nr:ATP-binding cassette domain-containing protein [Candidatus Neomarinimicrobiota bacterium]MCF7851407.1 ATP-binding cassette domain-containing protein [Candidatus Neomarinimicrobiota bacterium]MCF7904658.1 ATP-binding cassette domain-containing protein [Candidatus Neomarinimicrobiota bacterium]